VTKSSELRRKEQSPRESERMAGVTSAGRASSPSRTVTTMGSNTHEAALDNVLARFHRVRRNGEGWTAQCPAHEDREPSLSVHERDGKILLHCHAGCSVQAICAAAEIGMSDLFPGKEAAVRVVAEYRYVDEHGKLLYVVERREPKAFRQRRPDGRGGWTWKLGGVRRVLYRLPEILTADEVLGPSGPFARVRRKSEPDLYRPGATPKMMR
jgi:predicted protein tyrosine phosphatase